MPRFKLSKYVSEHSLTDFRNFEDLHPKSDSEACENGSNTEQGAPAEEDISTTSIPLEKTLNAETNVRDMKFNDGDISGTSAKSGDVSQELLKTFSSDEKTGEPELRSPSVSATSIKSFNSNSNLESSDEFSNSEKLSSVPISSLTTLTAVSSLGSEEINPESDTGDTEVVSSERPLENELNTSLGKGLVMVLDQFNTLRRVSQQEELVRHLQANPETTSQNPDTIKALDSLQNKDIEKIQHFNQLGEYMKNLHSSKEICDVEIHVDNDIFTAHRTVLSCFSSYFSDLFSKSTGEYKVPVVVRVSGVRSDAFRLFLDFAYDRKIDVNFEILTKVIKMAETLGIPVLREHCLKTVENFSFEKAIQFLTEGKQSPDSYHFAFAVTRVAEEFSKVYHCEDFFKLDVDTVCLIFSDNHLCVSSEMDVFRVAFKWIAYSMNERRQHLPRVMKHIRYPYMTRRELFECFEIFDMLKECSNLKNIILQANW